MAASQTVSIRILEKEYQVNCPEDEKDALLKAARQLDERMQTIRNSGAVIGLERIAVMAALNLVYDLEKANTSAIEQSELSTGLHRIDEKLSQTLQALEQTTIF